MDSIHKNEENAVWERIIISSMDKCISKLSKISQGRWSISRTKISWNNLDEIMNSYVPREGTGVGVYFQIAGDYPWTAMIIFQPEDVEIISKFFFGDYYTRLSHLNHAQELILAEFGNVILNSFVGSLSNILEKAFIPSVPKCIQGKTDYLIEALEIIIQDLPRQKIVTIELELSHDNLTSKSEILGIIPENLEKEINAALYKKS